MSANKSIIHEYYLDACNQIEYLQPGSTDQTPIPTYMADPHQPHQTGKSNGWQRKHRGKRESNFKIEYIEDLWYITPYRNGEMEVMAALQPHRHLAPPGVSRHSERGTICSQPHGCLEQWSSSQTQTSRLHHHRLRPKGG
jgi:hypothetical protein